jgi:hypothetical protein
MIFGSVVVGIIFLIGIGLIYRAFYLITHVTKHPEEVGIAGFIGIMFIIMAAGIAQILWGYMF